MLEDDPHLILRFQKSDIPIIRFKSSEYSFFETPVFYLYIKKPICVDGDFFEHMPAQFLFKSCGASFLIHGFIVFQKKIRQFEESEHYEILFLNHLSYRLKNEQSAYFCSTDFKKLLEDIFLDIGIQRNNIIIDESESSDKNQYFYLEDSISVIDLLIRICIENKRYFLWRFLDHQEVLYVFECNKPLEFDSYHLPCYRSEIYLKNEKYIWNINENFTIYSGFQYRSISFFTNKLELQLGDQVKISGYSEDFYRIIKIQWSAYYHQNRLIATLKVTACPEIDFPRFFRINSKYTSSVYSPIIPGSIVGSIDPSGYYTASLSDFECGSPESVIYHLPKTQPYIHQKQGFHYPVTHGSPVYIGFLDHSDSKPFILHSMFNEAALQPPVETVNQQCLQLPTKQSIHISDSIGQIVLKNRCHQFLLSQFYSTIQLSADMGNMELFSSQHIRFTAERFLSSAMGDFETVLSGDCQFHILKKTTFSCENLLLRSNRNFLIHANQMVGLNAGRNDIRFFSDSVFFQSQRDLSFYAANGVINIRFSMQGKFVAETQLRLSNELGGVSLSENKIAFWAPHIILSAACIHLQAASIQLS